MTENILKSLSIYQAENGGIRLREDLEKETFWATQLDLSSYQKFLQAVDDIKLLSRDNSQIEISQVLDLVKKFSPTWFSLESYDKQKFPKTEKTT